MQGMRTMKVVCVCAVCYNNPNYVHKPHTRWKTASGQYIGMALDGRHTRQYWLQFIGIISNDQFIALAAPRDALTRIA